jgi:ADP-ribose pyrophosphatase YjhB (NUDIX family)
MSCTSQPVTVHLLLMNWIKRHILIKLTLAATARYSQLRPKDVEGNLFLYHLEQLIAEGLVEKVDKAYQLTLMGRREAGRLTVDTGRVRLQPKIVIMLVCRNAQGQYLLYKWRRQPFMNLISLPYGKLQYGELLHEAAARELHGKANMTGRFSRIGEVYVKTLVGPEVLNHMLAHVFMVDDYSGTLPASLVSGEVFWW